MPVLKLLGGAVVEDDAGESLGLASRRHPLALLALLATAPSHTMSRSKLVGLLWPDSSEERARNRLNTCAHNIRRELGADVLVSVGDDLRLNVDALSCDVRRFREALDDGDARAAVELYEGPFLDGFFLGGSVEFEHRVDQVRGRFRRDYLDALEALAEETVARGEPEAAARWWRLRAEEDPYDSRTARRLVEALAAAGNRAAALRHARRHARRLEADLGTEPGSELRELVERLEGTDEGDGAAGSSTGLPADAPARPRGGGGREVRRDRRREEVAASRSRHRAMRRGVEALVILGLLAAAATAAWYLVGSGGEAGGPGGRTIAVLPFRTVGEASPAGFTEGLYQDLVTRLSAISSLEVISPITARRLQETGRPLPAAAGRLGISWVVDAGVQQVGERVRVEARLIDAASDTHVWSRNYDRELTAENLFEIQGEIARQIADALQARITPAEEERVASVPTENTAAYELYLQYQGLARAPRTGDAARASDRRIRLLRRTLELDSTFAPAWARLAHHFVGRAWIEDDPRRWVDSGRVAARKALALDPGLADAWAQLGDSYWPVDGPVEEQIAAYRKALELQPSHLETVNNLSILYAWRGRLAEAMEVLGRAHRLAPDVPRFLGGLYDHNAAIGRDEVAEAWLEVARERGIPLHGAQFGVALFYREDFEGARALLEELSDERDELYLERRHAALALYEGDWSEARRRYLALYPGRGTASSYVYGGLLADRVGLAYALDRLGEKGEARRIAREIGEEAGREVERGSPVFMPRHRLAVAHLILGDTARALDRLEESVEIGWRSAKKLRTIPTLVPLRDHPRFRSLVDRVETLVAEERRRIEQGGWGAPPGFLADAGGSP